MAVDLVIGAPAWDRAWSLPLWFQSVRANVHPPDTGLVFVVPPTDDGTREVINELSSGFDWVEVIRDRGTQLQRAERPAERHATLAAARNAILQVVERVQPRHYLSWDTDFLIPRDTVWDLRKENHPLITVWGWLNRQPPRELTYRSEGVDRRVLWQEAPRQTAMGLGRDGRPFHYPAYEYGARSQGFWPCGVALAWQLMSPSAYRVASYAPHHDGEDVPFNLRLHQRGIARMCAGHVRGVHLYDRSANHEIGMGWPGVMRLADQEPLAATWTGDRSDEYEALGFFPAEQEQAA